MKWLILIILLFIGSCSTVESCDRSVKGLYPGESYSVVQRHDIRVYYLHKREIYVSCLVAYPTERIRSLLIEKYTPKEDK
jgi:hypothetical protein